MAVNREERVLLFSTWKMMGLVSPEFHTCSDSRSFRVGITFCRLACFVGRSAIVWFVRSCCCWWVGWFCFAFVLFLCCCLLSLKEQLTRCCVVDVKIECLLTSISLRSDMACVF